MKCIKIYGHSDGNTFKVAHLVHESEDTTMQLDDWNTITQVLKLRFKIAEDIDLFYDDSLPWIFPIAFGEELQPGDSLPWILPVEFAGNDDGEFYSDALPWVFPVAFGEESNHDDALPWVLPIALGDVTKSEDESDESTN